MAVPSVLTTRKRPTSASPTSSSSTTKRSRQESEQSLAQTQLAQAIDPALNALTINGNLSMAGPSWSVYAQPSWPAGERTESAMRSTGSAVSDQQSEAVANFFVGMPYTNGQLGQSLYSQGQSEPEVLASAPASVQLSASNEANAATPSQLDQFTIQIATSLSQTYTETVQSQTRLLDGINALQTRLTESSAHAMAAGVGTELGDEDCLMRLNVLSSQISKLNRRVISSLKGLYGATYNGPVANGAPSETALDVNGDALPDLDQTTFAELAASSTSNPPESTHTRTRRTRGPKGTRRQTTSSNIIAPIIPAAATPQAAVTQWLSGDPDAGLTTPLKDWPHEWRRGNQIYCQRRTIYRGWEMAGKDWTVFTTLYGGKVSMAAKAITQARIQSGEIKTRQRKRNLEDDAEGEGGGGDEDAVGEDEL